VSGDPVEVAKGLRDFAKANPLLVIKGGVLDGKALSSADIDKLADLESREVLLAKLAGAMLASLSQAAALFQAPLAKAARTVEALRAQMEAAGGGASAITTEEVATEEVAPAEAAIDAAPASDATESSGAAESSDVDDAPAAEVAAAVESGETAADSAPEAPTE
jgi:large subunit ribosomal protein L10